MLLLALVQKYLMRTTEKSDGIKKDSFVQFNVFEKYELNFQLHPLQPTSTLKSVNIFNLKSIPVF